MLPAQYKAWLPHHAAAASPPGDRSGGKYPRGSTFFGGCPPGRCNGGLSWLRQACSSSPEAVTQDRKSATSPVLPGTCWETRTNESTTCGLRSSALAISLHSTKSLHILAQGSYTQSSRGSFVPNTFC